MISTVTNDRCIEFRGLSTDTKPIAEYIGNGSVFLEMDTLIVYFFDEANQVWISSEQPEEEQEEEQSDEPILIP